MSFLRRLAPVPVLLALCGCVRTGGAEATDSGLSASAVAERERYLAVRVEAWSEGAGRQARWIVDRMEPGGARPERSIVRWADGGAFAVLSPKGGEAVSISRSAEIWGDFLESVLSRRAGVPLPVGVPSVPPAGQRILVYLKRDSGWVRFEGLRSREEVIRTSEPAAAAWLREHPEDVAGDVDSAAEAVEKLVEALDAW